MLAVNRISSKIAKEHPFSMFEHRRFAVAFDFCYHLPLQSNWHIFFSLFCYIFFPNFDFKFAKILFWIVVQFFFLISFLFFLSFFSQFLTWKNIFDSFPTEISSKHFDWWLFKCASCKALCWLFLMFST